MAILNDRMLPSSCFFSPLCSLKKRKWLPSRKCSVPAGSLSRHDPFSTQFRYKLRCSMDKTMRCCEIDMRRRKHYCLLDPKGCTKCFSLSFEASSSFV